LKLDDLGLEDVILGELVCDLADLCNEFIPKGFMVCPWVLNQLLPALVEHFEAHFHHLSVLVWHWLLVLGQYRSDLSENELRQRFDFLLVLDALELTEEALNENIGHVDVACHEATQRLSDQVEQVLVPAQLREELDLHRK